MESSKPGGSVQPGASLSALAGAERKKCGEADFERAHAHNGRFSRAVITRIQSQTLSQRVHEMLTSPARIRKSTTFSSENGQDVVRRRAGDIARYGLGCAACRQSKLDLQVA